MLFRLNCLESLMLPGSLPHPWIAVLKGHTVQDRLRQAQLLEAVTPKAALQPMTVRSSI